VLSAGYSVSGAGTFNLHFSRGLNPACCIRLQRSLHIDLLCLVSSITLPYAISVCRPVAPSVPYLPLSSMQTEFDGNQFPLMNDECKAKKIVVVTPNPHLTLTITVNCTAYHSPDRICDKIKKL